MAEHVDETRARNSELLEMKTYTVTNGNGQEIQVQALNDEEARAFGLNVDADKTRVGHNWGDAQKEDAKAGDDNSVSTVEAAQGGASRPGAASRKSAK